MRNFLVFIIFCACLYGGFDYYKNKYSKNPTSVPSSASQSTQKNLTVNNEKYNYTNINNNTLNYIKKYNGGQIYSMKNAYPKSLIYTNVVDTNCPYQLEFQKRINAYKNDSNWNRMYNFINYHRNRYTE